MSDDLRIQQRPSAMPYILGGGLVGAGAGYWGLDKIDATKKLVSDPGKFNSVQEIIDATNKKDEFVKLIEGASEEHKGAMEKIKGLGEKVKEAEDGWQTKLEAFFKEKGIKEQVTETVEEVVSEGTTKQGSLKKTLEHYGKEYNYRASQLESATTKEAKEKAREAIKELDKQFEEFTKKVVDQCEFQGDEARVRTLKENLAKELRTHRESLTQYYQRDHIIRSQEDLVGRFTKLQNESKSAKEALEKAYETLGEKIGRNNIKDLYRSNPGVADAAVARKLNLENSQLRFLEGLRDGLRDVDGMRITSISASGDDIIHALENNGIQFVTVDGKKQFLNRLPADQKKRLGKIFDGGEVTMEALEKAIKDSESTVNGIRNARDAVTNQSSAVQTARQRIKEMSERIALWYDGAQVKNGKLIKPDGTRWKAPKGAAGELPKIEWPAGANLKQDAMFDYVTGKQVKIKEVAKELSEEGKKAMKEFVEKNGDKAKAKTDVLDGFKDELKALTEGKINNKKLAVGVAATAAAVAGLALLFRPKAKEQA